ncbi:lactate utilization protein C [Mucilaginibacter lutimaris]|uniref:Lactate utilization protein C n=1 Tax=Mucilaginibacter lutimaris TaxID=931629 RepID=A0ABW2ZCH6_9SPHI
MTAREKILADVRINQPPLVAAPDIAIWENKPKADASAILETFKTVAGNVGGRVIRVSSISDIKTHLNIPQGARVITTIPQLFDIANDSALFAGATPHELEDVELAILQAEFGVAENSALWVTEKQMGTRVLPFICQHLAFVVNASDIVAGMHQAYLRTQGSDHGFASFIAGPSKTADIEQSLVLGAHGPRSLVIFIIG